MDEALKGRWISALRSGDYNQTTNALNNGRGFCCLGVLCEVLVEDGVVERIPDIRKDSPEVAYGVVGVPYSYSTALLPTEVQALTGLKVPAGAVLQKEDIYELLTEEEIRRLDDFFDGQGYGPLSLADLNDAGIPFSRIAELIERFV